mgnify:FL=1
MKYYLSKYKFIYILIFIFLVLSLGFSNFLSKADTDFYDPAGDTKSYLSLAESLNDTRNFVRLEYGGYGIETIRTPIYPLIIMLFLENLKFLILVQTLLHITSALMIYKLVSTFLKQKFSLFVFFIFLFNPTLFSLSQMLITETISIFLIVLSIYVYTEKKNKLVFYLIFGLLPLLRPAFIVLSFGMVLFIKILEKEFDKKKTMTAIFLLILPSLVWTARNFEKTEMVIFSSLSGMNLLEETASGVMAISEDIDEEESFFEIINVEYEERRYWSQVLRNEVALGNISRVIANAPGPSPHLVASEYQSYAVKKILENPLELIILVVRSFTFLILESGDHLVGYVFELSNLKIYEIIVIFTNGVVVFFAWKFIISTIFIDKTIDRLIIIYFLVLTPLLMLATPHARFGSVLIFFHLFFLSRELEKYFADKNGDI